ncbi:hypothetical protein NDU88_002867 [Pleurodeles waltl]|uniref:Uncharacterized protein n=1 Tax=Pleurodeles waltl TaxID=8319 RepID=A0AAV7PAE2_PLEWA|nr:hypothetical protein NDU88_002867 [Pleurodeles waltl]
MEWSAGAAHSGDIDGSRVRGSLPVGPVTLLTSCLGHRHYHEMEPVTLSQYGEEEERGSQWFPREALDEAHTQRLTVRLSSTIVGPMIRVWRPRSPWGWSDGLAGDGEVGGSLQLGEEE